MFQWDFLFFYSVIVTDLHLVCHILCSIFVFPGEVVYKVRYRFLVLLSWVHKIFCLKLFQKKCFVFFFKFKKSELAKCFNQFLYAYCVLLRIEEG